MEPISSSYFIYKAKIVLGALVGVGFIVIASLVIFPNTAANRIKRRTEHVLERLGNATFQALGDFVQVRLVETLSVESSCKPDLGAYR